MEDDMNEQKPNTSWSGLGGLFAGLFVLFVATRPLLWGQGTAYISGYVLDATDAAVPNASVGIKNVASGVKISLQTNEAGLYRSPSLEPGNYEVTVTAKGSDT